MSRSASRKAIRVWTKKEEKQWPSSQTHTTSSLQPRLERVLAASGNLAAATILSYLSFRELRRLRSANQKIKAAVNPQTMLSHPSRQSLVVKLPLITGFETWRDVALALTRIHTLGVRPTGKLQVHLRLPSEHKSIGPVNHKNMSSAPVAQILRGVRDFHFRCDNDVADNMMESPIPLITQMPQLRTLILESRESVAATWLVENGGTMPTNSFFASVIESHVAIANSLTALDLSHWNVRTATGSICQALRGLEQFVVLTTLALPGSRYLNLVRDLRPTGGGLEPPVLCSSTVRSLSLVAPWWQRIEFDDEQEIELEPPVAGEFFEQLGVMFPNVEELGLVAPSTESLDSAIMDELGCQTNFIELVSSRDILRHLPHLRIFDNVHFYLEAQDETESLRAFLRAWQECPPPDVAPPSGVKDAADTTDTYLLAMDKITLMAFAPSVVVNKDNRTQKKTTRQVELFNHMFIRILGSRALDRTREVGFGFMVPYRGGRRVFCDNAVCPGLFIRRSNEAVLPCPCARLALGAVNLVPRTKAPVTDDAADEKQSWILRLPSLEELSISSDMWIAMRFHKLDTHLLYLLDRFDLDQPYPSCLSSAQEQLSPSSSSH